MKKEFEEASELDGCERFFLIMSFSIEHVDEELPYVNQADSRIWLTKAKRGLPSQGRVIFHIVPCLTCKTR